MIHFLLNIDDAIAERNTSVFIALCNTKLKLGIDESRLQTLHYHEFLLLPEVVNYRQRLGDRNFERALRWIELEPHHRIHMYPLKHAIAGISQLAKIGTLTYYSTHQTHYSTQLQAQVMQATRAWLSVHHFPCSDRVLFYDDSHDKLCSITELVMSNAYHLVVIDAHYGPLLTDLSSLSQNLLKKMQHSFTLYAFGMVEETQSDAIEVVAFPGWEHTDACIQSWIERLEERFAHASPRLKSWR
ncbi:hypothetical protein KSF_029850 [Reticulibacter mediterranei]|uniref:Uncharacterized protein n=1 Tax=Reticulibacter mediterranei TaxID=2778369 RepID=A0A8J3IKH5_9CHLR|nr:hypothetical protein [Reticulibacter mediterranei]GHO92937.1 hypothetical protein KSF_029850 [Reticulibacter mediterranei]